MSLLGSILSTLDDKKVGVMKSQVIGANKTSTPTSTPTNGKRKAESELPRTSDKASKINPISSAQKISGTVSSPASTLKTASRPSGYRGTANIANTSTTANAASKPSPQAHVAVEAKPSLKKGSFAEIMARAKTAAVAAPIGMITHKPKEALSTKKELLLAKEALKNKKRTGGRDFKVTKRSKSHSPPSTKHVSGNNPQDKPVRQLGYTGTAKPKPQPQTSYKGTMKPVSHGTSSAHKKPSTGLSQDHRKASPSSRRKEYYSDEEEDDDEEDEEGYEYNSEDYSDMDAGFDELEDEDERATRLAKKEDDYEKMMLDELKRQKEAKRKRMEELAARQRARKY